MADSEFVAFLQWSLPRLRLNWRGFRNVRGTVRKRVSKRIAELGVGDLMAYRRWIERHPEEWSVLDAMCRIPISRFYRDRAVFDTLASCILPERAAYAQANDQTVRIWSAGCASGEEPYTIAMIWRVQVAHGYTGVGLDVVATDADETMIERARRGFYQDGSLRELPPGWSPQCFQRDGPWWCVGQELRRGISFQCADLRASMPEGPFDIVLCRNLAFTYFDQNLQEAIAERLLGRLRARGVLIIGSHEELPAAAKATRRAPCIFERAGS